MDLAIISGAILLTYVSLVSLKNPLFILAIPFSYLATKKLHSLMKATGNTAVIVGAGNAGRLLSIDLLKKERDIEIVGFIDDDPIKLGSKINDINVIGATTDLVDLCRQKKVSTIYIAIPSAREEDLARIKKTAANTNANVRLLPDFQSLILETPKQIDFSALPIESLLERKSITIQDRQIEDLIRQKIILITGSGGSIGSEIVRQLSKLNPSRLILVDSSEFNLFQIDQELNHKGFTHFSSYICDIRNSFRLNEIFSRHKPDIVYHAAAYKHVTMMEQNPVEAFTTNVHGTYNVAKAAIQHQASKFILISSDKAVHPSNIMGATKKIAEKIVHMLQDESSKTVLSAVRFGNVLMSNGSVIPIFQNQIEVGGPLTVTDPDVTRYFMSIPEACQLVIHSSAICEPGYRYILEMGNPIKILSLAEKLIVMSGLRPYEDIKIVFTGLKYGEKLHEELIEQDETIISSTLDHIKIIKPKNLSSPFINALGQALAVTHSDEAHVRQIISTLASV